MATINISFIILKRVLLLILTSAVFLFKVTISPESINESGSSLISYDDGDDACDDELSYGGVYELYDEICGDVSWDDDDGLLVYNLLKKVRKIVALRSLP